MTQLKMRYKIIFTLIIVILFFLIPEVILRLYIRMASYKAIALSEWIPTSFKLEILKHSYLEPDPLLSWRLRCKKTDVAVNSFGTRGREFSKNKESGVFRIVCLGDSCTYGSSIAKDEDTYCKILEKILNSGKNELLRYEVINAGVPGYSSYRVLVYLQKKILQWKPDLVTVYIGNNNDFAINRFFDIEPSAKRPIILQINNFFEHSYLYNLMKNYLLKLKIHLLTKLSKDFPAEYHKISYELLETHFLKIINTARENNFKVIFLKYPTLAFGEEKLGEGTEVNQSIKKASQEGDVPLVDTIKALKDNGGKKLFLDTVHLNKEGHRVIAREIFKTLLDEGIVSKNNYEINSSGENRSLNKF